MFVWLVETLLMGRLRCDMYDLQQLCIPNPRPFALTPFLEPLFASFFFF